MIISNIWAQFYIYIEISKIIVLISSYNFEKARKIVFYHISTFLHIYALSPKSEKCIARIKYVLCDNYKSLIFILVGSSTCQSLNT